jgi:hypothetical protein
MDSNLRTDKLLDQIGWKLLHELQVNGRLSSPTPNWGVA